MDFIKFFIQRCLAKLLAMIFLTALLGLLTPWIIVLLSYFSGLDIVILSKLFSLSAAGGILAYLYHDFSWDDFTWDDKIKLGVGEQLINRKTIEDLNQNPLIHFSGQDNGEENPNQGGDQDFDPLVDSNYSENASNDQGSDMAYDSGVTDIEEDYIDELRPLPLEDKSKEVVEFESRPNPYTESGRPALESSDLFSRPVIKDDDSDKIKDLKEQYIGRLQERERDLQEILSSIEEREQDIASGELSQKEKSKEARIIRKLEEEAREIGNTIPYDRDELNWEVDNINSKSSSNTDSVEESSLSEDNGKSSKRAHSPSEIDDQPESKRNKVEESLEDSNDNSTSAP